MKFARASFVYGEVYEGDVGVTDEAENRVVSGFTDEEGC